MPLDPGGSWIGRQKLSRRVRIAIRPRGRMWTLTRGLSDRYQAGIGFLGWYRYISIHMGYCCMPY